MPGEEVDDEELDTGERRQWDGHPLENLTSILSPSVWENLGKLWPLKQLHPQHPFKQLCYRIFLTKGSSCGAIPWVLQFYYVLLDEVEGWASPIAWRLLFICRTGTFGMFMVFAAQAMSFPCFRFENSKHLSFDPKISLKIEYVDLKKGGN